MLTGYVIPEFKTLYHSKKTGPGFAMALFLVGCNRLKYQHGIPIGAELVFFLDGQVIGLKNKIIACER